MTPINRPTGTLRRFAPLVILVLAMVLIFSMGWHKLLSLRTVGMNYEWLKAQIAEHLAISLWIYILTYVAVVALSLPGGLVMTLTGGLLFGWKIGAPATVIGATTGATIVFLIARSSFGQSLAARAGPWLVKLRDGFKENALSYLLFLRLVPAFPFVVVNLAPALLNVPLSTYVIGTFLGIIPGSIAYSIAGAGLASIVEAQNRVYHDCVSKIAATSSNVCEYKIDTSQLVTKELIAAFVALGIVALIPIVIKKWSKRDAAA